MNSMQICLTPSRAAAAAGHRFYLRVQVTLPAPEQRRLPIAWTVILDRSGSMSEPAVELAAIDDRRLVLSKLVAALQATERALDSLADGDSFALVTFASRGRVAVPMTTLDSAARTRIRRAIQSIDTGGNTNLESGICLGQEQFDAARRKTHLCRALILSDGEANTGLTDTDGLSSLVHAMARQGVAVSAGGFGLEYNVGLMQALANAGGGNLQHITDPRTLQGFFDAELCATGAVGARAATLTVHPAPGVGLGPNLGGIWQEVGGDGSVRVFLGDLSAARSVYFEVETAVDARRAALTARVDWQAADDVPEMTAGRLDLPVWPLEHVEALPADPDVLAEAANCLLARAMADAGSRYDRGDTAGASGAVAEARAVYERIACYSSAPIGGGVVEKLAGMGESIGRRDLCREDVKAMAAEGFQLTRGSGGNPKSSRRQA